jgi:alanyl-tRNA synthetase
MGKPKIDRVKLSQMLRDGKTGKECAEYFDVTPAAITKAKKELNINVVKTVALEAAHKVVDKNLDAVAQLQKINENANELLDLCMRWQRGDDEALQILESQVKKVRIGKTEKFVEEMKFKDPRDIALAAMREIRGQLNLQLDIFKTMYDMAAVAEFQKEVLTAIGEEAPDVRNRIIQRLKESRALRQSVSVN